MTTIISAEAISNNIDLLTEILVRLPTKPLIKFKSVSKQWLCLITDPQFCDSHTRHHLTPTALLLQSRTATVKFEIVPLKHDPMLTVSSFDYFNFHDLRIRQSCNGLLLCSSKSYVLGKHGLEPTYYICNPTTKQFKGHSPLSCEFRESLVSVCMAFDPVKSNHYKLICVRTVQNKESYQIHTYSSHTDSWSDHLEITFTFPSGIDFADPVFCNGAVHWYSKEETSVYFDVDTECFDIMPMPKLAQREVWYFGESRGHLHLIVTELPFPLQFDVLEMASDYSGWFVWYHVNLDDVRIQFPENRNRFSVLNVVRAQKEEESVIVISVDNKAISYNVHDGTSKKLCDLEQQPAWLSPYYRWSDTFQYFESLTSV